MADCTDSGNTLREADQPSCQFQVEDLGRCGVYPYGYTIDLTSHNVVEPCFLLKLNKDSFLLCLLSTLQQTET